MNLSDPATWPKHPDLSYWRISRAHPIAHAVYGEQAETLCSAVLPGPETRVAPTGGYTRLCLSCIQALKAWGYLPRSEVVEE